MQSPYLKKTRLLSLGSPAPTLRLVHVLNDRLGLRGRVRKHPSVFAILSLCKQLAAGLQGNVHARQPCRQARCRLHRSAEARTHSNTDSWAVCISPSMVLD
eukprot:365530-Chlamydomonas_euryale.AAC.11